MMMTNHLKFKRKFFFSKQVLCHKISCQWRCGGPVVMSLASGEAVELISSSDRCMNPYIYNMK